MRFCQNSFKKLPLILMQTLKELFGWEIMKWLFRAHLLSSCMRQSCSLSYIIYLIINPQPILMEVEVAVSLCILCIDEDCVHTCICACKYICVCICVYTHTYMTLPYSYSYISYNISLILTHIYMTLPYSYFSIIAKYSIVS